MSSEVTVAMQVLVWYVLSLCYFDRLRDILCLANEGMEFMGSDGYVSEE